MIKLAITDDLSVSIANGIRIEKSFPSEKGALDVDAVSLSDKEFDLVVIAVKNMRAMMEGLEETVHG